MGKTIKLLHKNKVSAKADNNMMDNLLNSMFNSRPLYDELKVKCHPDKFIDEVKKAEAETLFRKLQVCKHDIQKMMELKNQIDSLCESK